MKKTLLLLLAIGFSLACQASLGSTGSTSHPDSGPTAPQAKIKVNILLKEQADATALSREASRFPSKDARRSFVVNTLKRQAEASQYALIAFLKELEANDMAEDIRPLWIVNSVSCHVDETLLPALKQRADVRMAYPCEELASLDDEGSLPAVYGNGREIAENLLKVNADKAWELGFTGQGVVIAIIDTGVEMSHADLQGRLWDGGTAYPHHGYDFYSHDDDPSDTQGHGTHVAGILVGTGASGTQTGVAPDAEIMVLKVFHGEDNLSEATLWVEAMQFALDHGADVLNMSLGQPLPNASVKLMLRQACDNTLAAGVVAAVCAGNSRQIQMLAPVPNNIWSPGDCPPPYLHEDQMVNAGGTSCVICVGAVDNNDVLGGFSSEGPSTWTDVTQFNDYPYVSGSPTQIGLIRPDVCAPGVNIKSLDYNTSNGYCLNSGTSMATPMVAGTIALMLSKNRELTPEQIDEILERTAVPLSEHKSNDFGAGRIDALAAVNAVTPDALGDPGLDTALVYPNPAKGAFTVTCDDLRQVQVYSADGRLVLQVTPSNIPCRIEGLSSGFYLISIVTGKGTVTRKVVVL
ncbi:MAG: S8 family peptidase [Bacteroidales bacterium]|nr:S8 family peptidase [Bacteroidales bacterium]